MRTCAVVVLTVLLSAGSAHALRTEIVEGAMKEITVKVSPLRQTSIMTSDPVMGMDLVDWGDFRAERRSPKLVVLRPRRESGMFWGTFRIGTPRYELIVNVEGTLEPEKADSAIRIVHKDDAALISDAVEFRAAERIREVEAKCTAERDASAEATAATLEETRARTQHMGLFRRPRQVVQLDDRAPPGGPIGIRGTAIIEDARGNYHLELELTNRMEHVVGLSKVVVEDSVTRRNYTARVTFDDTQESDSVQLKPGQKISAIVALTTTTFIDNAVSVSVSAESFDRPIYRDRIEFVFGARPNEGVLTLGLMASYGAVWIPNAQPLAFTELDATSMTVLGVRLSYGLHKRFNFEVEGAYASTGEARYADGGTRSARLGRLLVGAVLRLGTERWIPIARGGAGLQVASYEGVGDGIDVNPLWHLGLGLDRRLGPCAIGIGASLVGAIYGQGRSVEAGVQFGCGWKL